MGGGIRHPAKAITQKKTISKTSTGKRGGFYRFTDEEKKDIMQQMTERLSNGEAVAKAAKACGITDTTWYNWSKELKPVKKNKTSTTQEFECDSCDKVFTSQKYLDNHVANKHAPAKHSKQRDVNPITGQPD